jgi:hypothetical protein
MGDNSVMNGESVQRKTSVRGGGERERIIFLSSGLYSAHASRQITGSVSSARRFASFSMWV